MSLQQGSPVVPKWQGATTKFLGTAAALCPEHIVPHFTQNIQALTGFVTICYLYHNTIGVRYLQKLYETPKRPVNVLFMALLYYMCTTAEKFSREMNVVGINGPDVGEV
jgi:hypothetical protein